MATVSTADFHNGIVLNLEGDLMEIVEFQHVKPGKGGAFVRARFRNIRTGRNLERTFRSGERFDEAYLETMNWQYLYDDGDLLHFMHPENFDQVVANKSIIGDQLQWMKENDLVTLVFYERDPIMVKLPPHGVFTITQSDPGVQGDRSSGATKPATIETGAVIQVPLFLNEGDKVKVDTRTGAYIERVS